MQHVKLAVFMLVTIVAIVATANLWYYHTYHGFGSTHHLSPTSHSLFSTTTSGALPKGVQLVRTSKKGTIVHHAITNVSISDLVDLKSESFLDAEQSTLKNMTREEALVGREELVAILNDAGVTEIDVETLSLLPKWETVVKLYGDKPVIYGLDTCEDFRQRIPRNDASLAVAGIFNTGTNLLAMYLSANCRIVENPQRNNGMRWQVSWGKHIPAENKWTNTAKNEKKQNKTNQYPVVIVRDPYGWMNSMCHHPYAAKWHHSDKHCPNLVPNEHDYAIFPFPGKNIPVRITFSKENKIFKKWNSLAHVWSGWNNQYKEADYPRLMVRFEDLVFHPRGLVEQVCACAGAVPMEEGKFVYMVDSAKWGPGHGHDAQTSLISAMIKYGSEARRMQGFTREDLELAHEALDPELMKIFNYQVPLADSS